MARALITGCSTGIGRATAQAMARRGYEVVATARRRETLEGLDVYARLQLDVVDDASVRAAVETAGEIDVLVNNAAWEVYGPAEALPVDRVLAMFDTNVVGPLRLIQAVAPGMRERRRGIIVNISSAAGVIAGPLNGGYSSTKHALEALSESLRYELGHWGIRVVLIEPGEVNTAWHENAQAFGQDGPYAELFAQLLSNYPNPNAPGPEVVSDVIIEAVEAEHPRFRWPVNVRPEVLAARRQMDDETWERQYRAVRRIDW